MDGLEWLPRPLTTADEKRFLRTATSIRDIGESTSRKEAKEEETRREENRSDQDSITTTGATMVSDVSNYVYVYVGMVFVCGSVGLFGVAGLLSQLSCEGPKTRQKIGRKIGREVGSNSRRQKKP